MTVDCWKKLINDQCLCVIFAKTKGLGMKIIAKKNKKKKNKLKNNLLFGGHVAYAGAFEKCTSFWEITRK